jgi:hypothetical protein
VALRGRPSWPRLAILLGIAGFGTLAVHNVAAWVLFALRRAYEGDFALYYVFARIGLHEGFNHLYDVAAQLKETRALGPLLWYPAPYTPPLAWLVAPFAVLPFPIAYGVWNVLLGAALLTTWWLLAPGSRSIRGLQLAAALALPVVAFSLVLGQVVLIVGLALALTAWLIQRGSPLLAGLTLSVIAIKPQLALLVPLALLAGLRIRPVVAWAVASAGIAVAALLTLGVSGILAYAARLRDASHALDAYQVPAGLTLPGVVGSPLAASLVQALVVVAVGVAAVRQRGRGAGWAIAIGVVGSLLVTPFYHSDDLAVLLPAIWLWMRTTPPAWERVAMPAGFLAAQLLGTPLPLVICLAAALVTPGDLLYLTRAASRSAGAGSRLPRPDPGTGS